MGCGTSKASKQPQVGGSCRAPTPPTAAPAAPLDAPPAPASAAAAAGRPPGHALPSAAGPSGSGSGSGAAAQQPSNTPEALQAAEAPAAEAATSSSACAPARRAHSTTLEALVQDVRAAGPTAAALGLPHFLTSQGASAPPAQALAPELQSVADSMPPDLKSAPIRLLHIDAVLGWPNIRMFEEVPSSDCREVAYEQVDDATWAQVAVLSWRWAAGKPATLQPSYSPMSERQFQELQALLRVGRDDGGLSYVWVDWCCVPQYGSASAFLLEVMRSRVFYARAGTMIILPSSCPLPADGPVRQVLQQAQRALAARGTQGSAAAAAAAAVLEGPVAKGQVATCEYFGRVWTLAERMARYGRGENLCHWLTLEAWLGMAVDALLRCGAHDQPAAADAAYLHMVGPEAGQLLSVVVGVLRPLAEVRQASNLLVAGLDQQAAQLFEMLTAAWHAARAPTDAPTKAWLHTYLSREGPSGMYRASADADLVWALYGYYSWYRPAGGMTRDGLKAALSGLMDAAGGDRAAYQAGIGDALGLSMTPEAVARAAAKLAAAAGRGDSEAVARWIAHGAPLDTREEVTGQTALWRASDAGHLDAVTLLLEAGANKETKSKTGETPLLRACRSGQAAVARVLIAAGADVEARDKEGTTAVFWSAREGQLEALSCLLEAGANKDAMDQYGCTALWWASSGGHAEAVRMLLAAGADKDSLHDACKAPLLAACSEGQLAVARLLLDAGASVDTADENDATPLWCASARGSLELVALLLAAGPKDLDARNTAGETALWRASAMGHAEVVQALLEAGADKNAGNEDGETPLFRATEQGMEAVVQLLEAAGAVADIADQYKP